MSTKNKSEILFEKYLNAEGLSFEYEKSWNHTKSKPDYLILHKDEEIILDITEVNLQKLEELRDFGDVQKKLKTSALRSKINSKLSQLGNFANKISLIVIYAELHQFWFTDPDHVYESLYGDLAIISTFHNQTGYIPGSERWTYTKNGKFGKNRNTNISAVVTLRKIDDENLGVIVFENCYATNPLPQDIFCGAYDVRYLIESNVIKQAFWGKNLASFPNTNQELVRYLS